MIFFGEGSLRSTIFIAKLLVNPSFDFLHHSRSFDNGHFALLGVDSPLAMGKLAAKRPWITRVM